MTLQADRERPDARAIVGSAGILFAALVVLLAVIDRTSPLPFMPLSWHANRALWYLMAVGGMLGGFAVLWSHRTRDFPGRSGAGVAEPRFERVVLYTRVNCHLCDEAKEVLAEHRRHLPEIQEVDIDADPDLREKFDVCVPVVEIDGKLRFRGRVNRVLLRRLIDAAEPVAAPNE